MLNNLLSNAIKHTERGGTVTAFCFLHKKGATLDAEALLLEAPWLAREGNLAYGQEGEGSGAIISDSIVVGVTDTGEGIASENMGKLWNKFIQFNSSARQKDHEGTGLGLVIVKGIVETHGGVVGANSKMGQGSTFYFTLPL